MPHIFCQTSPMKRLPTTMLGVDRPVSVMTTLSRIQFLKRSKGKSYEL